MTIRFVMVGGFLGAGKTTAIGRLARHFTDAGKRVGLVTNDQAYDLVDTKSLRAQGFDVGEVPGACFCCKFDDLTSTMSELEEGARPDLIIAEPVGSCTDLAATVIAPMQAMFGERYEMGPLTVLLKPEHGRKILGGGKVGFSPQAAYIFLKQIEEADVVVIHKADKLSESEVEELTAAVRERFPEKIVLAASAATGQGFDQLIPLLESATSNRDRFMEVDYQVYAEGEAELGWLNCQANLTAKDSLDLDALILSVMERLRAALLEADLEPAHLKILAEADGSTAIANLVGGDTPVELSLASERQAAHVDLVVNARVAADPDQLESLVRQSLAEEAAARDAQLEVHGMQRFRPAPPQPTHRYQ